VVSTVPWPLSMEACKRPAAMNRESSLDGDVSHVEMAIERVNGFRQCIKKMGRNRAVRHVKSVLSLDQGRSTKREKIERRNEEGWTTKENTLTHRSIPTSPQTPNARRPGLDFDGFPAVACVREYAFLWCQNARAGRGGARG